MVSHSYFIFRALSAIKKNADGTRAGLFEQLYGGLYYELAGIKKSKVNGVTDEDLLFESVGIGSKGNRVDKLFDELRSDKRGVLNRSQITGKPRLWEIFPSLAKLGGILSRTSDVADGDIDIGQRVTLNLVKARVKAHETIFTRRNGYNGFALIKVADGSLQDEVPPDIANDTTVPAPHTKRLQSGISCIRCHGPDIDGWKELGNDALGRRLDIIGDVTERNKLVADTNDRLAGWYASKDHEDALRIARDIFAKAILRTSGGWIEGREKAQAEIVRVSSDRIGRIYNAYWYELVSTRQALIELGFDVAEERAVMFFNALLPPVGPVEDRRIEDLKEGRGINRSDFDLVYSFAAARALKSIKELERRLKDPALRVPAPMRKAG